MSYPNYQWSSFKSTFAAVDSTIAYASLFTDCGCTVFETAEGWVETDSHGGPFGLVFFVLSYSAGSHGGAPTRSCHCWMYITMFLSCRMCLIKHGRPHFVQPLKISPSDVTMCAKWRPRDTSCRQHKWSRAVINRIVMISSYCSFVCHVRAFTCLSPSLTCWYITDICYRLVSHRRTCLITTAGVIHCHLYVWNKITSDFNTRTIAFVCGVSSAQLLTLWHQAVRMFVSY